MSMTRAGLRPKSPVRRPKSGSGHHETARWLYPEKDSGQHDHYLSVFFWLIVGMIPLSPTVLNTILVGFDFSIFFFGGCYLV